jgi:peptidoglycan hydrolase-like protein with peptidoglycan-binding domain
MSNVKEMKILIEGFSKFLNETIAPDELKTRAQSALNSGDEETYRALVLNIETNFEVDEVTQRWLDALATRAATVFPESMNIGREFADALVKVMNGRSVLKRGMKGDEIRALQAMVKIRLDANDIDIDLGTTGPSNDGVDGDFGPKLEIAVEALQRHYNIQVDGEVGRQTFYALQQNRRPTAANNPDGDVVEPTRPREASSEDSEESTDSVEAAPMVQQNGDPTTIDDVTAILLSRHNDYAELAYSVDGDTIQFHNPDDRADVAYSFSNNNGEDMGFGRRFGSLKFSPPNEITDAGVLINSEMKDILNSIIDTGSQQEGVALFESRFRRLAEL